MWQKQLHMTQLQKTKDQKLKMQKKFHKCSKFSTCMMLLKKTDISWLITVTLFSV